MLLYVNVNLIYLANLAHLSSPGLLPFLFSQIYSQLNQTYVTYSGDISSSTTLDWGSSCELTSSGTASGFSTCVIALTSASLSTWRSTKVSGESLPLLFFYKYGIASYTSLTVSD